MAWGPGKYDLEVTQLRESTQAEGIILIVLGGNRGEGFSSQLTLPALLAMPQILRTIADQIERSGPAA
jgi:hypothetical protein